MGIDEIVGIIERICGIIVIASALRVDDRALSFIFLLIGAMFYFMGSTINQNT